MSRGFRLAGLLRIRRLAEDQAVGELAAARRLERAAEDRRRRTEDALGDAAFPAESDPRAFHAVVAARAALGGLLAEQRTVSDAAADAVRAREADWSVARRETRTLEKLEEHHDVRVRAAEEHAEQQVVDEIAGRRAGDAERGAATGDAPGPGGQPRG